MPRKPRYTTKASTPVEATVHRGETRTNIPTVEMVDFVVRDEQAPYAVRYPRDPSLDPQLVWKGKDEQDGSDLEVPAVPIYIQEHISPRAIVEDLRREQNEGAPRQAGLFADFNGMEFSDRIDFYRHDQNWTNRMILGDSLLVMTSLAEKEGLKGKVQMIYLDPPYGIKFGSNWQVSTRKRDVKDGKAEDATREPEQIKAFRDTWKLGIHSYLSYLRDRLAVARELLTETGSVFVQIGDENVHLVRCLMDEVFGSENFCSDIGFRTAAGQPSTLLASLYDHLLWYAKDRTLVKYRELYRERDLFERTGTFSWIELPDKTVRRLTSKERTGQTAIPSGNLFKDADVTTALKPGEQSSPVRFENAEFTLAGGLKYIDGIDKLIAVGRVAVIGNRLCGKRYESDNPVVKFANVWPDTMMGTFELTKEPKIYAVQTAPKVIERCLLLTTDPGDLVLDPTCGSGTTAYVAEKWGRRWITVDTSRVAIALARTRLMSARFPYYLLADSPEGARKEAELVGAGLKPAPTPPPTDGDIKKGFVYKRVPHVTLKSIANNPDIKEGMTRQEIDAAIARHAESETLYDQPYQNNKVVRVTGPFTVESLSPHRVLATEEERPASEREAQQAATVGQFETMILDNLRKAGVQNTVKSERLRFERLDTYAGEHLHAQGEYAENGETKRVAVCIGPEHGTVGPELIKDAAKEAVRGIGFDLLVVCGFAFDAHVAEEAKRYGKLTVLTAKINPDLQMGDEFLKKTGAGNLFMVFGEPDVVIHRVPSSVALSEAKGLGGAKDSSVVALPQNDTGENNEKIVVEIKGLDVYDPTTGQIRSHTTDDIACWFIDTDYNEESFFVRHAYFCGGDEPYDKLKRALRAEIDEAAWSALYSTRSRPFEPPSKGKIAIKVINHYGDEVLKVYQV